MICRPCACDQQFTVLNLPRKFQLNSEQATVSLLNKSKKPATIGTRIQEKCGCLKVRFVLSDRHIKGECRSRPSLSRSILNHIMTRCKGCSFRLTSLTKLLVWCQSSRDSRSAFIRPVEPMRTCFVNCAWEFDGGCSVRCCCTSSRHSASLR